MRQRGWSLLESVERPSECDKKITYTAAASRGESGTCQRQRASSEARQPRTAVIREGPRGAAEGEAKKESRPQLEPVGVALAMRAFNYIWSMGLSTRQSPLKRWYLP